MRELGQPEPHFYFAGMKSYARAPTFLMLTGYEQVRSIAAGPRRACASTAGDPPIEASGSCAPAPAAPQKCCCGLSLSDWNVKYTAVVQRPVSSQAAPTR